MLEAMSVLTTEKANDNSRRSDSKPSADAAPSKDRNFEETYDADRQPRAVFSTSTEEPLASDVDRSDTALSETSAPEVSAEPQDTTTEVEPSEFKDETDGMQPESEAPGTTTLSEHIKKVSLENHSEAPNQNLKTPIAGQVFVEKEQEEFVSVSAPKKTSQ